MKTEAQNFAGNYPLAGEKIGPLWRKLWEDLSDRTWTASPLLADRADEQGLARVTALNLLVKARKCGHLEVRYRMFRSRRTAFYRVIS